jgi:integrase
MRVEDFDFVKGTVTIVRSAWRNMETSPKSQKGRRTIYLDSRTLAEVKALLDGRLTGRIFATHNGTPLKSGDVNRDVLKPICKQLGIPLGTITRSGMVEYRRWKAEGLLGRSSSWKSVTVACA